MFGGQVAANIEEVVGVAFSASSGSFDRFTSAGSNVQSIIWLAPLRSRFAPCFFVEHETANGDFKAAFSQDRGTYKERWVRLGFDWGTALGEKAGFRFSLQTAPEVISKRSNLSGRSLNVDSTVFVLETKKQDTSTHLGGRVGISARRARTSLFIFFRTRPRIGSDLEWGVRLGFLF
jgi:hypothetical protein